MDDPLQQPVPRKWVIELDKRDVMAAAGGMLIVIGAAWFHPALGAIAIGIGLVGLAWRLAA